MRDSHSSTLHTQRAASVRTVPHIDLEPLRHFVREQLIPQTSLNDEKGQFNPDIFRALWGLGLANAIIPRRFGGPEMPLCDLIWVSRELGYGSGGIATCMVGQVLGFSAVSGKGSDQLIETLTRKMHQEPRLWSMAMSEVAAGSDLVNTATIARPVDGGYVISGEKNYITNGGYATDLAIYARIPDAQGGKISCFYVPGDSQGLIRESHYKKMGLRDSSTARLVLQEIFVPTASLVGAPGDGLAILGKCLERSKTLLAAASVGLASRALDLALQHMTETSRSGRPLIDHHSIRHQLIRHATDLEASWLLTCKAASLWDEGRNATAEASMAKNFAADRCFHIAQECVEYLGSKGYMADAEVGRIMRDIKGFEIIEGPSLVQELIISKSLLPKITPMVTPAATGKKKEVA